MTPTLLRLQVLDNGWHPLPVKGKAPAVPDWERHCRSAPTVEDVESWERSYRRAQSTGIALGRQVAIDIDILSDPALAQHIRAEAVACFGSTPFVRIGRAPKLALIYRAAEPITTQHYKAVSCNGDGVDVLSDGTQFVAFGIHPETGQLYQWVGEASPLDAPPDDAVPAITEAQVNEFVDRVHRWMPRGGGTSGKRPAGTGFTQAIIRGPSGLVVDGREAFLATCVWQAARSLEEAGEPRAAGAVASLAWSHFTDPTEGADLSDGAWTERHALHKARGTVRRLNSGAAKFNQQTAADPPTPITPGPSTRPARGLGRPFRSTSTRPTPTTPQKTRTPSRRFTPFGLRQASVKRAQ